MFGVLVTARFVAGGFVTEPQQQHVLKQSIDICRMYTDMVLLMMMIIVMSSRIRRDK